jgi:hypothetical protein
MPIVFFYIRSKHSCRLDKPGSRNIIRDTAFFRAIGKLQRNISFSIKKFLMKEINFRYANERILIPFSAFWFLIASNAQFTKASLEASGVTGSLCSNAIKSIGRSSFCAGSKR